MITPEKRYFCRACPDASFPAEALKLAEEYAAALPREQCVAEGQYEQRLHACDACPHLRAGYTCVLCGCFVVVRAKKKGQDCPDLVMGRWPHDDE